MISYKILILFSILSYALTNYGEVFAHSNFNSLKWSTIRIVEFSSYADVNIEYPLFIGGKDVVGINAYIEGVVLEKLNKDKETVQNWINAEKNIALGILSPQKADQLYNYLEGCEPDWATHRRGVKHYHHCSVNLTSVYRVTSIINGIVNIEIIFTDFTGGGNGNHDKPIIIKYDLKTNKVLGDDDLFCEENYKNKLSQKVLAYLEKNEDFAWWDVFEHIGKNEKGEPDINYMQYITDATKGAIEAEDFGNILLGYRGLAFVFPPYELSSGAQGIARIKVPYNALRGVLCLP